MEISDIRAAMKEVKIVSVKPVFTTKFYDKVEDLWCLDESTVMCWRTVGPKEVRSFVWPKVTFRGRDGEETFSFTVMNPHSQYHRSSFDEFRKAVFRCAFGKRRRISEDVYREVDRWAGIFKQEVDSRLLSGCRSKNLTKKVVEIWRKARRKKAAKDLQSTMEKLCDDLTDYDVQEVWTSVKKTRKVREVMDS